MPDVSNVTAAPLSLGPIGPGTGRISLPKPLTSFIGRERELAQAIRLLQGSCLVTLTGPGGSGKTRLCIALAEAVAGDYPDGVYFVSLAPVQDPGLVPSTIAQSIGLQDARDRSLMEHLISQLAGRQVLIVLDNFEHLLVGAPVVIRLLQETDALRILVSSRSPLRVSGEQECPIPPLPVPDPGTRPTAAALAGCASVRLFAERAAAVRADGQLTMLHRVLRGGRHVLLVPAAHTAGVPADPILRPYREDLDVVSVAAAPVVLIRPDGHVAARGKPSRLETVAGYLRDLFVEPADQPGTHPEGRAPNAVRGTVTGQR